ncbi:MAG: class I SAM-dependent methyltransferase [Bacteroidetes bacterium]|nr:class I SAM-dependent methyltransferase [Bacteroidota bacterium]
MFQHEKCPLCGHSKFQPFLSCKDYTVSNEAFQIVSCENCSFKFTNPIPELSQIGNYYKSEDYISHSNTKKGLISKLYHFVRNYTLKQKLSLVSNHVPHGTILDYGCGTGMFLNICQNNGWKTLGIEPDEGARKIASEMGLEVVSDKSQISKAKKFNAITLWHVLEHVYDLNETLTFFSEQLEQNGVLIIAVPNHKSYDAKLYKEFWAAYDVPRHLYHFEKKTMGQLLLKFGFTLVETKPMKFDSFYVSLLSEKYKHGRTNYLSAFWTGLKSNFAAKKAENYSSVIYVFKKK